MSQAHGLSTTRTLVFLAAASFASAASLRACDPILPDIAAAFSTTPGDAAKVVTVFGVGYAIAGFCYGFIGDRFGKLRVMAATTILSSIATFACALATSLAMLTVARIAVA